MIEHSSEVGMNECASCHLTIVYDRHPSRITSCMIQKMSVATKMDESTSPSSPLVPMPLLSISSNSTIQKCANLPLRDTDIFICSYPKSGTTWMQHIVLSLLRSQSDNTIPPYGHVSDYAPFLEIDPHWDDNSDGLALWIQEKHQTLGRRVFNTHLRYEMLPAQRNSNSSTSVGVGVPDSSSSSKFIYLVRSPLDVCVSFYYHLSHQVEGGFEGNFDTFFQEWLYGRTAFGSWADHVMSFVPGLAANDPRRKFLFLTYEELVQDLPTVVSRIVDFLELDNVSVEKQALLLPIFTFAHMKSNINLFQPKSVSWKNQFCFLRNGQSGNSMSILSNAQIETFQKELQRRDFERILFNDLGQTNADVLEKIIRLLPK